MRATKATKTVRTAAIAAVQTLGVDGVRLRKSVGGGLLCAVWRHVSKRNVGLVP